MILQRCMLILFVIICAGRAQAADKPNIVLIISDYMGYSDTEPYGATDIRTPSISRLAEEGVKFTNFYAAAPVCGPARAALYSGRYPAAIGFETNISSDADGLDPAIPTLSRWLNDAGYKTALYGKWHLGFRPEFGPNAHGYDEFLGHLHWTVSYYSHVTATGEPGLYENENLVSRDGYLTDILTDEAVHFINNSQDEPFFLTLSYNAALPPYQPPGLPESEWGSGWDVNSASREDYVQMVERMDEGIGRVLKALDDNDVANNTLVAYLYDHGGRHLVNSAPLFHGFANLFEGGIRVPAILRHPGRLPAGRTESMPTIAMDLTTTILHVAGLGETADALDGIDLIPLPSERAQITRRQFFWQADFYDFGKQRAIMDGRFKYLEHGNTQFLFDLREDVSERNNLFNQEPEVVNKLRTALTNWQQSHQAQ